MSDNKYDQRTPLIQRDTSEVEPYGIDLSTSHEKSYLNQTTDLDNSNRQGANSEKTEQLLAEINLRVKNLREERQAKKEQASYSKILLTYADSTDKMLIIGGYSMSIITGLGLPSFVFIWGDIVNSYTDATDIVAAISPTCLQFTIIGSAIWVTSYFYYVLLVIMAERVGNKTRVNYLRAMLTQEISYYDQNNITELSARLSKETQAI